MSAAQDEVIATGKRLQKAHREFTAALARLRDEDARLAAFSFGLEKESDDD